MPSKEPHTRSHTKHKHPKRIQISVVRSVPTNTTNDLLCVRLSMSTPINRSEHTTRRTMKPFPALVPPPKPPSSHPHPHQSKPKKTISWTPSFTLCHHSRVSQCSHPRSLRVSCTDAGPIWIGISQIFFMYVSCCLASSSHWMWS